MGGYGSGGGGAISRGVRLRRSSNVARSGDVVRRCECDLCTGEVVRLTAVDGGRRVYERVCEYERDGKRRRPARRLLMAGVDVCVDGSRDKTLLSGAAGRGGS